eukprot:TRINITY_DN428_c0_g3_i5.p1 TRINITY_DN428_c0_g3~~TRINITY_DN428_c0_g3_i5.p1  ORF type:complete len:1329 (+),score=230.13 TRINITY_DN428_c0_g3_i5:197-4183(+)
MCLQETALTEFHQFQLLQEARTDPFLKSRRIILGPPQPGKVHNEAAAPNVAQRGGVAVMVKKYMMAVKETAMGDIAYTTRRVHAKVALDGGSTWLHVITLYCDVHDKAKREALLYETLNTVCPRLGNVPIVVAGDLNTTIDTSPVLKGALSDKGGWTDASAEASLRKGVPIPPTYVQNCATRPDYVLLNHLAASAMIDCETVDVKVRQHRGLRLKLDIATFRQMTYRYIIPKEIPKHVTTLPKPQPYSMITLLEGYKNAGDMDGAYRAVSQAAEEYMLHGSVLAADGGYHGRGLCTEPTLKRLAAPSAITSLGAASKAYITLDKLRITVTALCRRLDKLGSTTALPYDLNNCWKYLAKKAVKLKILEQSDAAWSTVQDLRNRAARIMKYVERREHDMNIACKIERDRRSRQELNTNFDANRRSFTAYLKGKTAGEASTTKMADGNVTVLLEELDKNFRESWKPLFQKYLSCDEPNFEDFATHFGNHISFCPMSAQPLTAQDLQTTLKKKANQRCAGVDGWRLSELAHLPKHILEAFAYIYNWVEETGTWPSAVLTALISMIPKSTSDDPLEHRPITVTSAFYRLWACARLPAMMTWQDLWITATQFGFRPKHSVDDLLLELTSHIEDALLGGGPLFGISVDFKKCFDTIPHGVTFSLVERMGISNCVLKPIRGIYANLERRLKFPQGVGEVFHTTNGILQGCPISPIFINAILATATKRVKEVSPARALSYADDLYFIARLTEDSIQRAMNIIDVLCSTTGMAIHLGKTKFFTTIANYSGNVSMGGHRFETVREITALGTRLFLSLTPRGHTDDTRIKTVFDWVERLSHSNLSMRNKMTIISESVLPAALYGCLFTQPSLKALETLRKHITNCLWGPDHPMRSPDALLGVVNKCHVADPLSAEQYKILGTMRRACTRDPRLLERLHRNRDAYRRISSTPQGPVGVVTSIMQQLGSGWSAFHNDIVPLSTQAANHKIRALLKTAIRGLLEKNRPSFTGVTKMDEQRTNEVQIELSRSNPLKAKRVLNLLTGAIFPYHPAVINETVGLMTKCLACDAAYDTSEHTTNLLEHTLWECPAHEQIRKENETRTALCLDRHKWPLCTQLHGIITQDGPEEHRELQIMLATVGGNLRSIFAQKQAKDFSEHIWRRTPTNGTPLAPMSYRWYLDKGLSHAYHPCLIPKILDWLSALKWCPNSGHISRVELAIDFAATSQSRLLWGQHDITHAARQLGLILGVLGRLHQKHTGKPLIPATESKSVHSLRTLGITGSSIRGYTTRPSFATPDVTHKILEQQLYPYCIIGNTLSGFEPKLFMSYFSTQAQPPPRGSIDR